MKKYFYLLFFALLVGLISAVIAIGILQTTELVIGKNNVTFNENFKPIYVKDFVKQYPEIQAVTYEEFGETGGYINHLQGIGENFILRPTKQYEIISSKNISIRIE